MKTRYLLLALASVLFASVSYAGMGGFLDVVESVAATNADVSGPGITPRPDIVDQSGQGNAKGLSNDRQVAALIIDSTGVTATTTSLVVFSSSTHMTGYAPVGYITASPTNGTITLKKSGYYRATFNASCLGTNGNVSVIQLATTTDDSSYTSLAAGKATVDHLTGALTVPTMTQAYFTVTSSQASAGTFHVVAEGSNSANTTTCASGELAVERVAPLQPVAVP